MPRQTRAAAAKASHEEKRTKASGAPARGAPARGPAGLSYDIKNSSDASFDDILEDVFDDEDAIPKSETSIKVLVPSKSIRETRAPLSLSSAGTSVHEDSSVYDFETPLTSALATPFEKSADRSASRKSAAKNLANVSKRLSSDYTPSSSKFRATRSKRGDKGHPYKSDEQIARELQAQEFAVDSEYGSGSEKKLPISSHKLEADSVEDFEDNSSGNRKSARKRRVTLVERIASKRQRTHSREPTRVSRSARKSNQTENLRSFELDDTLGSPDQSCDEVASDDDKDDSFSIDDQSSELSEISETSMLSVCKAVNAGKPTYQSPSSRKTPKERRKAVRERIKKLNSNREISDGPMLFRKAGETRSEFERRKLETSHPKFKTLWDDLAEVPAVKPCPTPQPSGISRTLKSFQLEGVDWMRKMESESQWKGGLLGDEMGMGKTIQAVSLIMSDYPAKKPSLVVVPPVALMQWSSEIKAYTDGKLKVLVHHNMDPKVKTMKVKDLMKYDVIMISYSGLESMHRKEVKGWKRDDGLVKENSRVHAIHYHRLILDEAHSIKSRTTQVAKACFALKSDHKWCLSGTPVQNRIGEFFSLLRFLEVEPFASYFCKECSCESLHWATDVHGKCSKCHHTGFQHVSLFNQELLNPITSGNIDERETAMKKLRLITDRIMLRRMKRDHTSAMELPPKKVVIRNEFFGPEERDFSRSIMTNTTRQFDTYVARGVELNNYANIFGLIMQMRQVANHPDLILKKKALGGQNILVCCICDEPAEEPIRSQCHHEFCRRCVKDFVRSFTGSGSEPDCPQCHISLRIDFDQPDIEQDEDAVKKTSIINRIKMEDWHSSSKIEMLIYELFSLRSNKRTCKSIVFSQFTSMLQLVEWRLRRAGFSTVMLDGSMSPAQRQKSIDYFMSNVHVEIFLVSLKAGGVALNLTEASRVFIVDPWWNPAAEWQSADRCHRIGQKRPCKITRLCIEDSVESRMVLLQEKKANLINGTVNGDDVALGKLTPEDLQFLFRGT